MGFKHMVKDNHLRIANTRIACAFVQANQSVFLPLECAVKSRH